jgi:hypothetical protein
MGNQDSSQYNLRWNEVLAELEFAAGNLWVSTGVGAVGGITQLTGAITAGPGTGSQVTTIANGVITNAMLNAAAGIAFSKLANLASGNLLVGSAGSVATAVTLSGDATLVNSGALTLANTAVTPGTYSIATITVDSKGRITNAATGTDTDNFVTSVSGTTGQINSTGGATPVLSLINTAVTPGSYTNTNLTVDQQGRITAATSGSDTDAFLPLSGGTMTGSIVLGKSLTYPLTTKTSADSPITIDSSNFTNVLVDVDGALTINGPTNGQQGRKITFVLEQDGAGHAVTFATGAGNFRFGTDIPSFTASGASKTDYVGAIWNADASRWDIVAVIQGF